MPCLHHLRRAAWLLSLCLLLAQSHLRAAALPTGRGQEEEARPGGGDNDRESPQPENSPAGRGMLPGPLGPEDQKRGGPDEGDLFQDVDPKALAAVLLQALQAEADKPSGGQSLNPEPSANEERVRSETKSSDAQEQPEKKAQGPRWEAGERSFGQQELDALKSMLEELQRYSSAAKRAEPPQGPPAPQERDDVLKELEEVSPTERKVRAEDARLPPHPPPPPPPHSQLPGCLLTPHPGHQAAAPLPTPSSGAHLKYLASRQERNLRGAFRQRHICFSAAVSQVGAPRAAMGQDRPPLRLSQLYKTAGSHPANAKLARTRPFLSPPSSGAVSQQAFQV
uniref:VGF nerve growth factor inducible n=1 Tax=Podarcis muralis TaxID=64176 RepID=A0A670KJN7_PODMU